MMAAKPVPLSRSGSPIEVSFEFFPPKTDEMEKTLWEAIERLAPIEPDFVSVTYGAGGSTRARTHATVARIARETSLEPAAHLTCVGASRAEIDAIVRDYRGAGVRHIVALRGDSPGGLDAPYVAPPDGYETTADLVAAIKRIGDFQVSVSAYPEKHPQSPTLLHDIETLKRKVDAGADRAITQFFFDNAVYLRFLDGAAAAGIKIPIVPGIVPVQNFKQTAGERARLARRPVRGPRRRSGHPPSGRGGGVRRAGDRPDRSRRHAIAFLYDEPRRSRVRDLSFDRVAREAGSARNVRHGGAAVVVSG
jgi:methylenetetrahydrofolate reductase (NADPH)